MEYIDPRSRALSPGQGFVANAELRGRTPEIQPAGRRAAVSHHMEIGAMVPEAMGFSPSLPGGDFGRGWHGHGRLELPLADVIPQPAPFTPHRGQQRPGTRASFGGGSGGGNAFDSQRSYGGYSVANATQAPESQRSYLSLHSPATSQRRGSRETTPRTEPGRASPVQAQPGGTPPPSQRRLGSYSTSSRDIGSAVGAPPGLRSHYDSQALPQPTTEGFKAAVGGVVPGYGGHVPHAPTHCGTSHVGGVAASSFEQRGHGERATRMAQQPAAEVAGNIASHVAAASIPGYQGHLPGSDLGAFGASNWRGVPSYGASTSPISSNAHHATMAAPSRGRPPFAGEPQRMANLDQAFGA